MSATKLNKNNTIHTPIHRFVYVCFCIYVYMNLCQYYTRSALGAIELAVHSALRRGDTLLAASTASTSTSTSERFSSFDCCVGHHNEIVINYNASDKCRCFYCLLVAHTRAYSCGDSCVASAAWHRHCLLPAASYCLLSSPHFSECNRLCHSIGGHSTAKVC